MTAVQSAAHEGPDLPPMSEHLSQTPIENIIRLMVCAVACGLTDEKDSAWVYSEDFAICCTYIGFDFAQIRQIRNMHMDGRLNVQRIAGLFNGRGGMND